MIKAKVPVQFLGPGDGIGRRYASGRFDHKGM